MDESDVWLDNACIVELNEAILATLSVDDERRRTPDGSVTMPNKVLVVEDEANLLKALEYNLNSQGYEVLTA